MIECEVCFEEYEEGDLQKHRQMCVLRLMFRCSLCGEDYMNKEGMLNHLDLHKIVDESKQSHYLEIKPKHKLHQCVLCNDQRAYSESLYLKHIDDVHDGFFQQHSDSGENFRSEDRKNDRAFSDSKASNQAKKVPVPIEVEDFEQKIDSLTSKPMNMNAANNVDNDIINQESLLPSVPETIPTDNSVQLLAPNGSSRSSGMKCEHCDKDFTCSLRTHFSKCHKPTKCSICGSIFEGTCRARYHRQTTHLKQNFECAKCSQKFHFITDYKRHLIDCDLAWSDLSSHENSGEPKPKDKNEASSINCSQCGREESNADSLARHNLFHHDPVACDSCGISFPSLLQAQRHRKLMHKEPQYKCSHCSIQFALGKRLRTHMAHCKYDKTSGKIPCAFCGSMYKNATCLNWHIKRCRAYKESKVQKQKNVEANLCEESGLSQTKCSYCEEECCSVELLNHHLKVCHQLTKCDICGITVFGSSSKSYHKIKCHMEPKYECTTCGRKFHYSKEYNAHRMSCERMKYVCKLCGKKYARTTNAYAHNKRCHPNESSLKNFQVIQDRKPTRNNVAIKAEETTISGSDDSQGQPTVPPSIAHLLADWSDDDFAESQASDICKTTFVSAEELLKHKEQKMVDCEICFEEYREGDLELHRPTCVLRLMARCSLCGEDFVSKEGLWNHLDLHQIVDESKELHYQEVKLKHKLHQCVLCNDQRAYSESTYRKHVHDVHNGNGFLRPEELKGSRKPEEEQVPPQQKTRRRTSSNSTKNMDLPSQFACDSCGETFFSKALVLRHKMAKFACAKGRPKKCLHCRRIFQPKEYEAHFPLCKRKPFACALCPLKFNSAKALQVHMRNGHGRRKGVAENSVSSSADKNVQQSVEKTSSTTTPPGTKCVQCGKECARPTNLRIHIRRSHRPSKCKICGIIVKGLTKMRYHTTRFHREPIECPTCGKKFHLKQKYDAHCAMHNMQIAPSQEPILTKDLQMEVTVEESTVNPSSNVDASGSRSSENTVANFDGDQSTDSHVNHKESLVVSAQASQPVVEDPSNNPYTCNICGITFSSYYQFNYHKIKHKEEDFPCPHCSRKFYFKGKMEAHAACCANLKHACEWCGQKFNIRSRVENHKKRVHPGGRPEQGEYKYRGPEESSLKDDNIEVKLDIKVEETTLQEQDYINSSEDPGRSSSPTMISGHKKPKYECANCLKKFYFIQHYTQHSDVCDPVQSGYSSNKGSGELILRERSDPNVEAENPSIGESLTKCSHCGIEESSSDTLARHIRIYHDPVACDFCGMTLPSLIRAQHHVKTMHHELKFKCPNCYTQCFAKKTLDKHLLKCNNEKTPCDYCGKMLKNETTAKKHRITACREYQRIKEQEQKNAEMDLVDESDSSSGMGIKPTPLTDSGSAGIKCHYCDEELSSPGYLRQHMKVTHELAKCDICGIPVLGISLRRHHKIKCHEEPKLECSNCGEKFHRKKQYDAHCFKCERKIYSCKLCGRTFHKLYSLKRHNKKRHAGESDFKILRIAQDPKQVTRNDDLQMEATVDGTKISERDDRGPSTNNPSYIDDVSDSRSNEHSLADLNDDDTQVIDEQCRMGSVATLSSSERQVVTVNTSQLDAVQEMTSCNICKITVDSSDALRKHKLTCPKFGANETSLNAENMEVKVEIEVEETTLQEQEYEISNEDPGRSCFPTSLTCPERIEKHNDSHFGADETSLKAENIEVKLKIEVEDTTLQEQEYDISNEDPGRSSSPTSITTHKKPKYECAKCLKRFYFLQHYKKHSDVCDPVQSDSSSNMSSGELILNDRSDPNLEAENPSIGESLTKCSHCGLEEPSPATLARHILINHDPVACDFCGMTLSSLVRAQHHMKTVHHESKFKCPHCYLQCNRKERLQNHLLKCNNQKIPCDYCGKMLKNAKTAKKHRITACREYQRIKEQKQKNAEMGLVEESDSSSGMETKPSPLADSGSSETKCHYCDEMFSSLGYLSQHLKVSHELTKCDICGISVLGISPKRNHKIKCHEEPKLECSNCGEKFHRKQQYNVHCFKCERKVGICKLCGYTFRQMNTLHRHNKKRHAGESNYEIRRIPPEPKRVQNNELQMEASADGTKLSKRGLSTVNPSSVDDVSHSRSNEHSLANLSNDDFIDTQVIDEEGRMGSVATLSSSERQIVTAKISQLDPAQEMTSCVICKITFDSSDALRKHKQTCPKPARDHDDSQFGASETSLIHGVKEAQTYSTIFPQGENTELKLEIKVEETLLQEKEY